MPLWNYAEMPVIDRLRAMKNLARLRKLKGWTQTDLALEVGVNQATISKAEKGDGGVSLSTYRSIAESLGVPVYQLFMDDAEVAEIRLLEVFRSLPEARQRGWLDTLDLLLEEDQQKQPL